MSVLLPPGADITASLEKIVAERKSQSTAAGTGLSGARHAGSTNAGGASSNDVMDATEGIRDELNALVDRVKGLRKVTAEATLFLPVYDLRRAQEVTRRNSSKLVDGWMDG